MYYPLVDPGFLEKAGGRERERDKAEQGSDSTTAPRVKFTSRETYNTIPWIHHDSDSEQA